MDLVKEAKQEIENLTTVQVKEELDKGNVTLIDLRESEELKQTGKIPDSFNVPRGVMEFYADPTHPYHKAEFNKNKRIILYCASGSRSALAAATLKQMGYDNVAHLDCGYNVWKEAGMVVTE